MKQAGVMLIIKDGLILGISRRHNKAIFGLPGGKFNPDPPDNDRDTKDTAVRETKEETTIIVKDCVFVYERVELGDGPQGVDYYSRCYYATDWSGEPKDSEEGNIAWLTAEEVTSTAAAFGSYNRKTLDIFKTMFPDVDLIGEWCPGGCNNTGWQTGDNEGFICDYCGRACTCDKRGKDPRCYVHQGEEE
jgi:ADP-ribose pyrophosphatase YjhB (NUDIX family)